MHFDVAVYDYDAGSHYSCRQVVNETPDNIEEARAEAFRLAGTDHQIT